MAKIIVGIDEVGRGCWAGPLVAGAVILETTLAELKDSKELSKKKRERLASDIRLNARAIGLGWVTAQEIDSLGLTESVRLAMQRALDEIRHEYDEIIIDGNINYLPENPKTRALIKADNLIPAASAASIMAKVARDKYMYEISLKYPQYGFQNHVGYGTAEHLRKLRDHGVTDLHRKSFKPIRALLQ